VSGKEELAVLVDELLPHRFEWGYRKATSSMSLADIPDLVRAVSIHQTIYSSKAELDQFCDGRYIWSRRVLEHNMCPPVAFILSLLLNG
jgi:hypothetical protein